MPMLKRWQHKPKGIGPSAALTTPAEQLRGPTTSALPADDDDRGRQPQRRHCWPRKLCAGKIAPTPESPRGRATRGLPTREWLPWLLLADAIVTLLVVPLRVGFFFDPFHSPPHAWTTALTVFTIVDLLSALVQCAPLICGRISNAMQRPRGHGGRRSVSDIAAFRMMPSKILPLAQSPKLKKDGDEVQAESPTSSSLVEPEETTPFQWMAIARFVLTGLALGPWALLLCATGAYNLSHVGGLWKLARVLYVLPDLFCEAILKPFGSLPIVRSLGFSTVALVVHGTWIGLYLCHLAAAGYMFIAHYECGIDFSACPTESAVPGCWVLKDNLERGSLWRQYVRTMYWASKTVTTLGQGDLVPATMMETNYCIIVQFFSGLWATCFLSATGFAFSRRDANMRTSIATRLEQTRQFVLARQLSKASMDSVTSYFRFIQRTRNGVDAASVLTALPARYRAQCSHEFKQDYVKRVRKWRLIPMFRTLQGAFFRAILDALESDFFSSDQVIVDYNSAEELLIVQTGEVRVSNTENVVVRRLLSGNFYADYALTRASKSVHRLVAESPSEIWWLPRRVFEDTVATHFPGGKRAWMLGRRASNVRETGLASSSNDVKDLALRKFMDKVDRDTAMSVRSVATWRFPSSRFRSWWRRVHCVCLLFVAIEVPVHIAFHRGFSALARNRSEFPGFVRQNVGFSLVLLVEAFFYLNWYFQAYVFVRRSSEGDDADNAGLIRTDHAHDLIVEHKQIFRHYLEIDGLVIDWLANLPIALAWDLAPRASTSVLWIRFFRLLRLVRLSQLRRELKTVMTELNVSPPTQLLAFNTIACIVLANLAASVFFLAADFTHVADGMLSLEDVFGHTPVSFSECLADASRSGNCTWFMYDYSQFGMDLAYLRSLHWSLVLLSTVGYGDILSFSNAECVVGFWWIYAGAVICYFTASATSSVISHWRVLAVVKSEKLEEINRTLMSFESLSPATIAVVQRYFLTTWRRNGSGTTASQVLEQLPKSVRARITYELYAGTISNCCVFVQANCVDAGFVQEVAATARSEIFMAGDVITGKGHTAEEAFVIQSGAVEVFVRAQIKAKPAKPAKPSLTRLSRFKSLRWLSSFGSVPAKPKATWRAVPVAVLRESDIVGEESFSYPEQSVYAVSARALTGTQVVIITRQSVLDLMDRFPDTATRLTAAVNATLDKIRRQVQVTQYNIENHHKMASADARNTRVTVNYVLHPDSAFARVWSALVALVLLYNFYQITFRLAFVPQPSLATMTILNRVDYAGDTLLILDIYFKWNHLGFTDAVSGNVLDRASVRRRYQNGWLVWDLLSVVPIYFPRDPFKMVVGRLPRLLKSPQLVESLRAFEEKLQKRFLTGGTVLLSVFDMTKFLVFFLSAAHHIGSLYYLLGRLQVEHGLAESSWVSVDAVLTAYPDHPIVHYVRSVYWCLETFTVVCFGDVLARNAAETVFASATCVLGWIFIGQIIGRMTSLVLNMDKEAHAHAERVNDFEEYAKRRSLPAIIRERAKECAEYKSKTLLELNAHAVFRDLPKHLRATVFDEAYGTLVRAVPEFAVLSGAQIQAVASALVLEIYLRHDVIFVEGSVAMRLYIMKQGRGELYSASSAMVFGSIHEGVMFGGAAFFLPGLRNFASARAHTSCQVLQLDRRRWTTLWPEPVRRSIEDKLMPLMRQKHRVMTHAFLSIVKNFELSKHSAIQRPVKLHHRRIVAMPLRGKLERQLLVDCFAGSRPSKQSWGTRTVAWIRSSLARFLSHLPALLRLNSHTDGYGFPGRLSNRRVAHARERSSNTRVQPATPDKEAAWIRHARKLRILHVLDRKKHAAIAALEAPGAIARGDDLRTGHSRSRRKSTSDQRPMPSTRAREASAYSSTSRPFSGYSTHSSQEDTRPPASFRRHSAHTNGHELFTKLVRHDVPGKSGAAMLDQQQCLDESPRQLPSGLPAQRSPASVRRTSSASLVVPVARVRPRSNSQQGIVQNDRGGATGQHGITSYARALGEVFTSAFKSQQAATELYGIWSEPPRPPSFVLEGSAFRRIWDMAMLAICVYYTLVVPFRASFLYDLLTQSHADDGRIVAWFVLEYAMDALCMGDFMLRKSCFSFVYRGEIVTDAQQIRDHYFREGSYIVDVVSLVPFEVLAFVKPWLLPRGHRATWYDIAVLRLPKVLRITHLHDLSERFQQTLLYDWKLPIVRPSLVYWARITLDFVLGAHWIACIMYAAAFACVADDSHASWLKQPAMLTFAGCSDVACVNAVPWLTKYARSYYFSMGAITTVSYGDIAPLNFAETLATILVIVLSIVLFGMLSGGFFQLLEMEFGRRADYEHRVAHIAHYMQRQRLPARLWQQMQVYFAVHWTISKGMHDDALLRGLTPSVTQDLACFVRQDFLKNLRLLASAEPAFARALVTALQPQLFVLHDIIVSQGDAQRTLFVIESGLVAVQLTDKRTGEPLQDVLKGRYEFVGEKSLVFGIAQTATCVALRACSIFVLTLERYEEILHHFPEYREKNEREWMFTQVAVSSAPKHR